MDLRKNLIEKLTLAQIRRGQKQQQKSNICTLKQLIILSTHEADFMTGGDFCFFYLFLWISFQDKWLGLPSMCGFAERNFKANCCFEPKEN